MEQDNKKAPLSLSRGTLGLKKPLTGNNVRQNVGGTSKVVKVEVRKTRKIQGEGHPRGRIC